MFPFSSSSPAQHTLSQLLRKGEKKMAARFPYQEAFPKVYGDSWFRSSGWIVGTKLKFFVEKLVKTAQIGAYENIEYPEYSYDGGGKFKCNHTIIFHVHCQFVEYHWDLAEHSAWKQEYQLELNKRQKQRKERKAAAAEEYRKNEPQRRREAEERAKQYAEQRAKWAKQEREERERKRPLNLGDFLHVLGLDPYPLPTKEKVVKKYRMKARELHPDRNKKEDATERFQELEKAYSIVITYYN
jgi:hypothetical protein